MKTFLLLLISMLVCFVGGSAMIYGGALPAMLTSLLTLAVSANLYDNLTLGYRR